MHRIWVWGRYSNHSATSTVIIPEQQKCEIFKFSNIKIILFKKRGSLSQILLKAHIIEYQKLRLDAIGGIVCVLIYGDLGEDLRASGSDCKDGSFWNKQTWVYIYICIRIRIRLVKMCHANIINKIIKRMIGNYNTGIAINRLKLL